MIYRKINTKYSKMRMLLPSGVAMSFFIGTNVLTCMPRVCQWRYLMLSVSVGCSGHNHIHCLVKRSLTHVRSFWPKPQWDSGLDQELKVYLVQAQWSRFYITLHELCTKLRNSRSTSNIRFDSLLKLEKIAKYSTSFMCIASFESVNLKFWFFYSFKTL